MRFQRIPQRIPGAVPLSRRDLGTESLAKNLKDFFRDSDCPESLRAANRDLGKVRKGFGNCE
jgi:hypothetical protein